MKGVGIIKEMRSERNDCEQAVVYPISGKVEIGGVMLRSRFLKGVSTSAELRQEEILEAVAVVTPVVINDLLGRQELEPVLTELFSNPDSNERTVRACSYLQKRGLGIKEVVEIIASQNQEVIVGLNIGSESKNRVDGEKIRLKEILGKYYPHKKKEK